MQDGTKPAPGDGQDAKPANGEVTPEDVVELSRNEAEGGDPSAAPEDEVTRLQTQVEVLEAEKSALRDQALRAVAEAENTRRRVERERGDAVRYAAIPLLRDLVKVADNLARALAALPEESVQGQEQLKSFRDGVVLTERELLAGLQRHQVARIDPLGEAFDPNLHEAMMEIPDAEKAPGTVVQVLEVGWKLHDRLIRPARVAVSRAA